MEKTNSSIALFEAKEVRKIWHNDEWFLSVVDIVEVLAETPYPRQYWEKIKQREFIELQLSPIWLQLKLESADGKKYATDCVNIKNAFRLIQSIPSKKAEPFKMWLAQVGKERLEEIQNPELAQERMKDLYEKKGYPKDWIDKRMRGIAVRQTLTDEWKERGAKHNLEFAILTNEIMTGAFEMDVDEYKSFKGLKRQNLRDHMNDMELILTMLAETTTTKFTKERDSHGFPLLKKDAKDGGAVAGRTRKDIEGQSGQAVSTNQNYFNLAKKKKLKSKPKRKSI